MSGETTVVKGKINVTKALEIMRGEQSPISSRILSQKLRVAEINNRNANQATMENSLFVAACAAAGVPVTTRQASKWRNKRGAAWTIGRVKLAEESR